MLRIVGMEILSDWGPLVALAGLLWRWTVSMGARLERFEGKVDKQGERIARIEGLLDGTKLHLRSEAAIGA